MLDSEYILNRMRKGDSAETIANEMAKLLNDAEEQLAKERKKVGFTKACKVAADALNNVYKEYGKLNGEDMSEYQTWTETEVADLCETFYNLGSALNSLTGLKFDTKSKKTTNSFDDVVAKFFKDNNI